jgi:hypothetical protein
MSAIYCEIDKIRKKMFQIKFLNEVDSLQNIKLEPKNSNDENKRVEQLNKILENIDLYFPGKKQKFMYTHRTEAPDLTLKRGNMNETFKEIDKYMMMKPWNRMTNFHREIKIKEFILDQKYEKDTHDKVSKILYDAINENKLKSNKYVVYDTKIQKILSIPILKENLDGSYYLKF